MPSIMPWEKNVKAEKHIMQMLSWSFEKERHTWKSCGYINNSSVLSGTEVSGKQRDKVVKWMLELNDSLSFSPETIFLTTAIIDHFLHTVKAHPKYLNCIAITSFYIASKIMEECEVIPSISWLLDISDCSYTISEVSRMERIILKKLNWNLKFVTTLDFLHMFHGLISVNYPDLLRMNHIASGNLSWLGARLKPVLLCHKLAAFPPSTVALCIISIELELGFKKWLPLMIYLQTFAENNYSEFIRCRNKVSHVSRIPRPDNYYECLFKPSLFIPMERNNKREEENSEEMCDVLKYLNG